MDADLAQKIINKTSNIKKPSNNDIQEGVKKRLESMENHFKKTKTIQNMAKKERDEQNYG